MLGLGSLTCSQGRETVSAQQWDAQSPGAPALGGCTARLVSTSGVSAGVMQGCDVTEVSLPAGL